MMKKICTAVISAVLSMTVAISAFGADTIYYPSTMIQENLPNERPELKEDFYVHVNYDALKNTVMPDGYSIFSAFDELDTRIKKNMLDILDHETGEGQQKLLFDFYNKYMDMDARNEAGWSSVIPYGEMILSAETQESLLERVCSVPALANQLLPVDFYVSEDEKDSLKEVAHITVADLDLADSAEYTEMTADGRRYKEADDQFFKKLLIKYGFDEAIAEEMIENRFALESKLAQYIYPTEVSYSPQWVQMTYNPYTEEELYTLSGAFPMESILTAFGVEHNEKYILDQPVYYEALQNIMTEDNLDEIKSWMLIGLLINASAYTDEDALLARIDWINAKYGSNGILPLNERAYTEIGRMFPELLGQLYAEKFFSPEEKEEVTAIVYDLIDVFRSRLKNLNWLSDATKATAIEKLDTMEVFVGYPEEMRFDYSEFEMTDDSDFYTNWMAFIVETAKQIAAYAGKETNRETWGASMAPNVVNACYTLTQNSICFPAAILQEPFFSKEYTFSGNMGAIGSVIGHEITHAFDTKGSQYDKDGNMNNWWTEEDHSSFEERTNAVADRYGAYALVDDMHVNGDLTIGETVADLGGVSAALQILEEREAAGEEIDYSEFFERNARIWFGIITKESESYMLKFDPHAPACLRTNVNLSQFDEFYETYDITEGDIMYTVPEERLAVW